MSLTTIVTVHCDGCGAWEYTADYDAATRRHQGWVTTNARSNWRQDYCPKCAPAAPAEPKPTAQPPDLLAALQASVERRAEPQTPKET